MAKTAFAATKLRSLVDRIGRLEEEKSALSADVREVYAEARGHGFDTKIMRQVVRIRPQYPSKRKENQAILDLYLDALGVS